VGFYNHSSGVGVLEDFLFPGERVLFKSPSEVKYRDGKFDMYITDQRIIAFQKKKEKLFAERFRELNNIRYKETGSLRKEAMIILRTVEGYEMTFNGKPSNVGMVWENIQKLDIAKKLGTSIGAHTKCKFCGATIQPSTLICPKCQKILR
jgi:hypothetical protein